MIRIFLLILCLSAGPLAWAAGAPAEDPWYEVEVIVFEHLGSTGEGSDRWTEEAGLPAFAEAIELAPAPPPFASETGEPPAHGVIHGSGVPAFQLMSDAEFRLASVMNRLMVSRDYEPLIHAAWRQPATGDAGFPGVHLHSAPADAPREDEVPGAAEDPLGGSQNTGEVMFVRDGGEHASVTSVDGLVKLGRGRFLHLNLDLLYRKPGTRAETGLFSIFNRQTITTEVFRLQQAKRVRSGELHYFDHPRFGAVVLITPFDVARDKAEAD